MPKTLPVAFVSVGAASQSSLTTLSTAAADLTAEVEAGWTVIVGIEEQGGAQPTSVTDSKGNTYTCACYQKFPISNQAVSIWYSKLTTGLVAGVDTWTLTCAATSPNGAVIRAISQDGLDGTVDVTGTTNNSTGSNAMSVATSANTTADDEFAFAIFAKGNASVLPVGNVSDEDYVSVAGGAAGVLCCNLRSTFASGSTKTASATSSESAQNWAAAIAVFKIDPNATARPVSNGSNRANPGEGRDAGYSGNNTTTGTTLALTGATATLAVGDTVFVAFAQNIITGSPTFAKTGGTCVLGSSSIISGAGISESGSGMVFLMRAEVTTAGTLTGITVTHASTSKRAGIAKVFRGVPLTSVAVYNGTTGSAGSLTLASQSNAGQPANQFVINAVGFAGVTSNAGVTYSRQNMDLISYPAAWAGTSGGGATSNQSIALVYLLVTRNSTPATGTNNALNMTTSRNGAQSGAFFQLSGAANIIGTAAGVGASTGALAAQPQLSGSSAGTGSTSGQTTIRQQLTGTTNGVGAATGAINIPALLTGSSAGSGATTATLMTQPKLSGSSAGTGATSGSLQTQPQLSGSSAGTGATTGALTAQPKLSGTAAGIGAATGQPSIQQQLSGSAAGSGTTTGALKASPQLSGSSAGSGNSTGTITFPSSSADITGTAGGTGATSGALSVTMLLSGSSDGLGAATGALAASPRLSGTAAGTGATTGNLSVTMLLSGSAAGTGATTGVLAASPRLTGSSTGTGATAGTLSTQPQLSGSSAGVGTTTGNLTVPGLAVLSGTAAGTGATSGALTASPRLSGTTSGVGTTTGTLKTTAALSGASAGTGNTTGSLKTQPQLTGSSNATGAATGALITQPKISGIAAGIGGSSGSISFPARVSGIASGFGNATGNLATLAAAQPIYPLNTYGHIEVAASGVISRGGKAGGIRASGAGSIQGDGKAGIIHEPTTGSVN